MGEETARLREEIDRTREDLTRDVDLLAEKTSPTRMVERRVERTRRGLIGLKDKVMGTSTSSAGHRTGYGTYGPTYTEDVYATGSGSGGAGSTLHSAKETTMDAASHAADSTRETLSSAREQVSHAGERAQDAAHQVKERTQEAAGTVREHTEGNPFAAGLVAFGIGWLVSSLMPPSEAETQAAQRAGELASEHGGPVLEQAKQAASEVGQNLQGHAQDAAQQVKERTQEAAGTVREEARTAATTS